VRGLVETTDCHVVICGRSRENAVAFARTLRDGERVSVAFLDRTRATAADLAALNVFCIVDAAGPFQASAYSLAKAAIDSGVHYIDLADARDFVAGFGALDEAAKAHGVLAVTGASSTPALTQAVLDELCRDWKRVDSVEIALSPGAAATMGLSVVRAILSYAGRPVNVWRFGRWDSAPGWGLLQRVAIEGLGKRFVALVETPDLDIVRMRFPTVRQAVFRAGVELTILQLGLWLLTFPVRWGVVRSLEPFSELLHAVAAWFRRFGSDKGGMIVEASGLDATGALTHSRWTLIAKAGDGPNIPALPALALARALAAGTIATRGATACVGLLSLEALTQEFSRYEISTAVTTERLSPTPLFQRLLAGFAAMPQAVREAHAPEPARELLGTVDIDGAENPFAQAIAWLVGFPSAGRDLRAAVTIEREGNGEVWVRRFGAAAFASHLSEVQPGKLAERFGPITFDLDTAADAQGFRLTITRARLGELPLPKFLTPHTDASASVDENGRYLFDVTIGLPVIGRLVRYRGWLTPA
jgi:hypothetical protein